MPTAAERKEELKEFALSIVRGQTNVYVKELLREHKVRIGATKEDFDNNLTQAIDDGVLTREHFEAWLQSVEGWGQQHVYVYRVTKDQVAPFATEAEARQRIKDARLLKYWRKPTAKATHFDFPDDENLHLVSITYSDSLLFHWHKGTTYWVRTREEEKHDKPNEWIGGFEYEFRAFRGRSMREVMRFEIRPSMGLAALFIPAPVNSKAHAVAYRRATDTISRVLDFPTVKKTPLLVADIIFNLDQKLAFDDQAEKVRPQSTRMKEGVSYVQFGGVSQDDSYFDSAGVKRVREALRTDEDIDKFEGTSGTFRFEGLGRVELLASDSRVRLWSSLTADKVWHILGLLAHYQVPR